MKKKGITFWGIIILGLVLLAILAALYFLFNSLEKSVGTIP